MRVTHAGFARDGAPAARASPTSSCGGRIVAVLEGGYDLDGLGGGMTATLEALLAERAADRRRVAPLPEPALARAAIDGTLARARRRGRQAA